MSQEMSDHQRAIWRRMLSRIEEYRRGQVGFAQFTRDLEGDLDAGEFHDRDLVKAWYSYWTPLEVRNAVAGDAVAQSDVAAELGELERFLRAKLVEA